MADDVRPSPAELVSNLVEGLPEEDRKRVLVWLLDRSIGAEPEFHAAHRLRLDVIETMPEFPTMEASGTSRHGGYQVVPIRLPTAQHAALREWCTDHGFSMATVVRGLVERFLDERVGR